MNNLKVLILIFISFGFVNAQTLERTVVASQGSYFNNSALEISWTLGEVITDTYLHSNIVLTQGFEQPVFMPSSDSIIVFEPTVLPNPTDGPLSFLLPKTDSYKMICYDIIGQIIFEETFTSNYINLNVSYLSNAYYVFVLTNSSEDFSYRVKILKIN